MTADEAFEHTPGCSYYDRNSQDCDCAQRRVATLTAENTELRNRVTALREAERLDKAQVDGLKAEARDWKDVATTQREVIQKLRENAERQADAERVDWATARTYVAGVCEEAAQLRAQVEDLTEARFGLLAENEQLRAELARTEAELEETLREGTAELQRADRLEAELARVRDALEFWLSMEVCGPDCDLPQHVKARGALKPTDKAEDRIWR